MADLYFKRSSFGLSPSEEAADAWLKKVPVGTDIRVTVTVPRDQRSIQQHRLYFALMKTILDNTDGVFANVDECSEYVKILAGHCDRRWIQYEGEKVPWFRPKSIAFAKMGQSEFQEFFNAALDVVVGRIIPGVDRAALEAEVLEMIQ